MPVRRRRPEQQIQAALVEHLRRRAQPGVVFLHPANGGFRRRTEAAILTGMGVVKGAPDLLLFARRELRAGTQVPAGRKSEAQIEMLARLDRAGSSLLSPMASTRAKCLEQWNLLKGETQ